MSQFKRNLNRFLIGIARFLTPVMHVGPYAVILRDAEVKEAINRNQDFTIEEINYENIFRHIGPFILGLDDGERYQRDIKILRGIVRKDDTERIKNFARQTSTELAQSLKGEFNLIWEFTRKVPLLFTGDYFGVPGPNPEDMLRWCRTIFWDIFLDLKGKEEVRAAATQSAKEMKVYLNELLQGNKATMNNGGRLKDNLFNRLLALQNTDQPHFSDDEICGNIAGVYMGAVEPISKSMVNILGQIFARKDVLAMTREAAAKDDVETLAGIAWEALRFHPNAPALMRFSEKEQRVGNNKRIKAGKKVLLMTQSAMFDPRVVDQPRKFIPGRSWDHYLYFGFGQHTCYGNYINFIVIPEMLNALFKIETLKPVSKVVWEGPFQDDWKFAV